MKMILFALAFAVLLALLLAGAPTAHGDDTKPLESPIHMTILPVSDALRNAPDAPEMARTTLNTSPETNAPATPVLTQSGANRDDTDADLSRGGRR